ncbi:MAG: TIGR03915 family putative DNA repair protein [Verrucomicrobiales bacterium]
MRTVVIQPVCESWRERARELLALRVPPGEVLWSDNAQEPGLFAEAQDASSRQPAPKVPPAFLRMARSVAAHNDPRRWGVLYRVLWRLTHGGELHLLDLATDRDMRQLAQWGKTIGRDIHKLHAFVRFRLVGRDEATGREQFVAWFEPDHRIVRLAAGFFEKRFAGMDWSILTPHECVHWDGSALHFTPGVSRSAAPDDDTLDDLWRTYFRSIFNPARLKVRAMQAEMPKNIGRICLRRRSSRS